ncbi:hypothetical protein TTHERM_001840000 (macronuclear) [Tetrahymena thermophila SB210]|uniref:Uncharacterized protein n=1 Tax=Tetrahymena thermophila (strain SB210) TaxID=312017 RepID=W7X9C7_TETTS|nr:hypothetical protein TTHERM_001840000 [Tetrahymena thermophila SB210]EWS72988.1 hypothetical protein TTHERM_001840000 [Tetrahymena thermophila SB210]|eukprot:XP_012654477.1 hypothetical protein TTHERM_001840000 [Tetrahymena thermophila SB210]
MVAKSVNKIHASSATISTAQILSQEFAYTKGVCRTSTFNPYKAIIKDNVNLFVILLTQQINSRIFAFKLRSVHFLIKVFKILSIT